MIIRFISFNNSGQFIKYNQEEQHQQDGALTTTEKNDFNEDAYCGY